VSDEQTTEVVPGGGPPHGAPYPEGALEEDEWPVRGPARGIRLAVPAAALIAVLLVGAGFWGGATLQKDRGSSSGGGGGGAAALASRLRALAGATGATGARGATGASGAGGLFGGGGGLGGAAAGTAGTISVVDGNVLYVLTTSGALVKVTLDPSTTTITRNAGTKAIDLRPGDTVVVQGTTSANGDVSATSVAATAPGVTSSRFGSGFFNRGTGSGSGSTSSGATG